MLLTLSANSSTLLKLQDFLLFILLIANSGNYLHLNILVHYKTIIAFFLLQLLSHLTSQTPELCPDERSFRMITLKQIVAIICTSIL